MQNTAACGTDSSAARTAALIADPYEVGAELRRMGPVHRITGPDGRPAWLVTRYDDVRQALADPRLSLDKRHALPGNYHGFSLPPLWTQICSTRTHRTTLECGGWRSRRSRPAGWIGYAPPCAE